MTRGQVKMKKGGWSDEDEENELQELQTERLILFFYSRE